MRVLTSDLPEALTLDHIKEAASLDPTYQKLKSTIRQGRRSQDEDMRAYNRVWGELGMVDGLVCRGEKIIIPDAELVRRGGNIRDWVIELGHSGHPGITTAKRLLRSRLWWPGMDDKTERRVESCLECQAATKVTRRDPLMPTNPPEEPWQVLAVDHWGPTRDGKHLLVLVDKLTRYPEVMVVRGTSGEANKAAFEEVFARHGNPAEVCSDNGPPLNGNEDHILQEYFKQEGIYHRPNQSPYDPEANGLAESFMKHVKKSWHAAIIAKKDPVRELQKHLKMVRATPHPSTGASPAELLFGRNFRTNLPDNRSNPAKGRQDILEARDRDMKEKAKQKMYKDGKATVRPHKVEVGDTILLERRTTKSDSPYDPRPYTAVEVHGTQIVGRRGEERKVRDSQRWKKVKLATKQQFSREEEQAQEDADIGPPAARHEEGVEGDQAEGQAEPQGAAGVQGEPEQVHPGRGKAVISKERWSFSPPRTQRPTRAMTRGLEAKKQAEKDRLHKRV